jgi:hypothetical protein
MVIGSELDGAEFHMILELLELVPDELTIALHWFSTHDSAHDRKGCNASPPE